MNTYDRLVSLLCEAQMPRGSQQDLIDYYKASLQGQARADFDKLSPDEQFKQIPGHMKLTRFKRALVGGGTTEIGLVAAATRKALGGSSDSVVSNVLNRG